MKEFSGALESQVHSSWIQSYLCSTVQYLRVLGPIIRVRVVRDGQLLERVPGARPKPICRGQSYTRKSQFSLNVHNLLIDGYLETANTVLGSFSWLVSGYHVTLLYDAGKYPKTSVFR